MPTQNRNKNSGQDRRGFASMDPDKQRNIAAEGGRGDHSPGHSSVVLRGRKTRAAGPRFPCVTETASDPGRIRLTLGVAMSGNRADEPGQRLLAGELGHHQGIVGVGFDIDAGDR